MATKPKNIIYGVDDRPPFLTALLLAWQHIFVLSSTLILPVVLIQTVGGSFTQVNSLIAFSMIAAGIGTAVQALRSNTIGSGYLVPNLCGPAYLSVSMQAIMLGGLPLMHGMTIFAGCCEAIFSRIVHRVRLFFPTEIIGLVVFLVGISLIHLGVRKFVGADYEIHNHINWHYLWVSATTLLIMAGINTFSKSKLKLYGVLIGMTAGYLISIALNFLTLEHLHKVFEANWFSLPGQGVELFQFTFKPELIFPFVIVSIVGALKTFGNISTAQRENNSNWKSPNTRNVGRGLLADSISVTLSGFLGGMATDSSSSNVGLSIATGATSRYIGFFIGALYLLLGFSPKVTTLVSIMPNPVMGAILVFVTYFMLVSGLQIIYQSKPNTYKIIMLVVSFIAGLTISTLTQPQHYLPNWLAIIAESTLTLSTMIAIILNFILKLGSAIPKNVS